MAKQDDTQSTPIPELLEGVIAASIERLSAMRDRAPGFAMLDEESLSELVTLLQTIESKASLSLWDAQIDRIRQERQEARDAADSEEHEARLPDTISADFSSPYVGRDYERFLTLLACAGGRDRFRALDVRRDKGVEAAVAFLEGCNVTAEADHGDKVNTGDAEDEINAASVLVQAIFCGTNGEHEISLAPEVPHLCNMLLARLNAAKRALGEDDEPKAPAA